MQTIITCRRDGISYSTWSALAVKSIQKSYKGSILLQLGQASAIKTSSSSSLFCAQLNPSPSFSSLLREGKGLTSMQVYTYRSLLAVVRVGSPMQPYLFSRTHVNITASDTVLTPFLLSFSLPFYRATQTERTCI